MKRRILLVLLMVLSSSLMLNSTEKVSIVHNTLQEIEACEGKLKLKLVRVWGGDDEEDRHKFFKSPIDIVIDNDDLVYILDKYKHHVKVFQHSGKYVRKIGGRGKGPGDLFSPEKLAISPEGHLMVLDDTGHRVQRFSPQGESKAIFQLGKYAGRWFGITSKNEFVGYSGMYTFYSRKLLTLRDKDGIKRKDIGTYHDKAPDYLQSEKLKFAIDQNDIIYVANKHTPVIRKYSTEGKMLGVITYETPIKSPFQVAMNENGDEIKITGEVKYGGEAREKKTATGTVVESGIDRVRLPSQNSGISLDSQGRIFMVTLRRVLVEEEKGIIGAVGSATGVKLIQIKKPTKIPTDHLRLIVLDTSGKVIAAVVMSEGGPHYVKGNRIFFKDSLVNKEIKEYEMTFDL